MAVKHHDPIGRYVTIEVDGQQYKVFYLSNGKGTPLICQHTAGCHNHQWRGLSIDDYGNLQCADKLTAYLFHLRDKKLYTVDRLLQL